MQLLPGPRERTGAPGWILHDPVRHRYFRLDWLSAQLLARWREGTPERLLTRLRDELPLGDTGAPPPPGTPATDGDAQDPLAQRLDELVAFLAQHQLLDSAHPASRARLRSQATAPAPGPLTRLLHNYLFFRLPLARPDAFLTRTAPRVAFLFRPAFLWLSVAAGLLGLFLAGRQWQGFLHTFTGYLTPEGLLLWALAIAGAKLLHELGHAYAAKQAGLRVPTMGVAFLVLWPVLYTDTSDAWRLPRRPRLTIAAAGMGAELALAAWATLAWSFLPEGPLKGICFFLATVGWLLSLGMNLNPFMRFDGYYLLADAWDLPNLQERAFAVARWRLRRWLLGWRTPFPDPDPQLRRPLVTLYAWATWGYRLALFTGIALLVYHWAFKALGIVLLAAELGFFLGRPMAREAMQWWRNRGAYGLNPRSLATLAGVAGLLALLLLPWSGRVALPAVFKAPARITLHAPFPVQLEQWLVTPGEVVAAGQPLATLAAPELHHRHALASARVAALELELARSETTPDARRQGPVLARRLAEARTALAGVEQQLARLRITAPLAGVVEEPPGDIGPGDWLKEGAPLLVIRQRDSGVVEAYTPEQDLFRLQIGTKGVFYSMDGVTAPIAAHIARVDGGALPHLPEAAMASTAGGEIPCHPDPSGHPIPREPHYRVVLHTAHPAPARLLPGRVVLHTAPRSLATAAWRRVVAVLVRESGF